MTQTTNVNYAYSMEGSAASGQTWHTNGTVTTESEGDFSGAVDAALLDTFKQLTNGKAVFGHPGVGCCGPYKITKFTIERRTRHD